MYHPDNPNIIEGSDIVGLVKSKVRRIGERTFGVLHVELNPAKDYPESAHQFHVTNGVLPRLLSPTNEDLDKLALKTAAEARLAAKAEEDTQAEAEKADADAEKAMNAAIKAEEKDAAQVEKVKESDAKATEAKAVSEHKGK